MNTSVTQTKSNKLPLLVLVLLNYFTFMLITTIIGVLLVDWKADFNLSLEMMGFLGAAFFIAYGLTSLPQGILVERIGNKKTFLWAASLIFAGSLFFALNPSFINGLISLFVVGTGVTALQIVGNLLVKRIDEDPEKYSRNLTMAQVFCGIGAMSGAFLNDFLSQNIANFHWTAFYFLFAVMIFALAAIAFCIDLPEKTEKKAQPTVKDYTSLISNPVMLMFAMGIFIYVGIEVGIANYIKEFTNATFGADFSIGDKIVGLYWLLQSVGRFTGGLVLNYIKTAKALTLYASAALICLMVAIFAPSITVSGIAFVAVGFFTSIMFPSIFALAVNKFSDQEETVSGVLCTAIIGGAVTQVAIGYLAVPTGLAASMAIIGAISYGYIAFIGIQQNANTISTEEEAAEELKKAA